MVTKEMRIKTRDSSFPATFQIIYKSFEWIFEIFKEVFI